MVPRAGLEPAQRKAGVLQTLGLSGAQPRDQMLVAGPALRVQAADQPAKSTTISDFDLPLPRRTAEGASRGERVRAPRALARVVSPNRARRDIRIFGPSSLKLRRASCFAQTEDESPAKRASAEDARERAEAAEGAKRDGVAGGTRTRMCSLCRRGRCHFRSPQHDWIQEQDSNLHCDGQSVGSCR